MIEGIHLVNFGCHTDKVLEFHPGLNVITGSNDVGKTTFIRAFDLLFFNNQPINTCYLTNTLKGTHTLEVSVIIDNHQITRRIKYKQDEEKTTKKDDEYEIDGKVLKAFGRNVPDEILKVHNFSDLNIQFQTDGPFLLLSSSGDVTCYLNKTIDLEIIDESFTNIRKTKRTNNQLVKQTEEEIEKIEEQLKEFDNLDLIRQRVEYIRQLNSDHSLLRDRITNISRKIDEYELFQLDLRKVKEALYYESRINSLCEEIRNLEEKEDLFSKMSTKFEFINSGNHELITRQEIINKTAQVENLLDLHKKYFNYKENYEKIKNMMEMYEKLMVRRADLKAILTKERSIVDLVFFIQKNKEFTDLKSKISNKLQTAELLMIQLENRKNTIRYLKEKLEKELGTVCPLCNQVIKKECKCQS